MVVLGCGIGCSELPAAGADGWYEAASLVQWMRKMSVLLA